ncbi:MAG: 16S rRNA (uracil(1498)-N(3))-methyltransferase [Filifactoraceae bacterium]
MDRFYVDSDARVKNYIDDKDEIKHITKVMRMKEGDSFEIFDVIGAEYLAEITELEKEKITFEIKENYEIKRELDTEIIIYQGLPKQQKMDYIIQKTTELGVSKIVPCILKRCVSDIKEKEEKKIERWQKIAFEATKQSKRTSIPSIIKPLSLKDAIYHSRNNGLNIVFYELEKENTLKLILKSLTIKPKSVGIFIGPEGGFSEEEIKLLKDNNVRSATLGTRILRTETAGIYGVSIISYEYE